MAPNIYLAVASVSGLLAVALGAFAAHGLQSLISADLLPIFSTAVDYHLSHTLALLAVSILLQRFPRDRFLHYSANAFIAGIMMFSGSLYGLSLSGVTWLGAVTPLGGLAFLLGWGLLAGFAWSLHWTAQPAGR